MFGCFAYINQCSILCMIIKIIFFICFLIYVWWEFRWGFQDKKIARSQRRLEEGGQGAMPMDTAAISKNDEIIELEAQASDSKQS